MWHIPTTQDMNGSIPIAFSPNGTIIQKPSGLEKGYIMAFLDGSQQYITINNTPINPSILNPSFKFIENTLFMRTQYTFYLLKEVAMGSPINFSSENEIFSFSKQITYANIFKDKGFYFLTIGFEDPDDFLSSHKLYVCMLNEDFEIISNTTFSQTLQHNTYGNFAIADVSYDPQNNKILLIGNTQVGYGYDRSFLLYIPNSGVFDREAPNTLIYFFSFPVYFHTNYFVEIGIFVDGYVEKTPKILWEDTSINPVLLNFEVAGYKIVYVNFIEFDLVNETPIKMQWDNYWSMSSIPSYRLVENIITPEEIAEYPNIHTTPRLNFKILNSKIYLYVQCTLSKQIGLDEFGNPIFERVYKKPITLVTLSTDLITPSVAEYKVNDDYISDTDWGNYSYFALDLFLVGDSVKVVASRSTWGTSPFLNGTLNYYLIETIPPPIIPPPILAIFNKIAPQYATHTDPTTTPPKQTPLQYITHTTFYNELSTEPPTPQNLQIKILPKDLKNFVSDDDDISFKVEFLNTLLETPNTTTRLTPVSILPPSILQVSKSDWDNSNIGDVLVVSRHYENLPNDEFYTTYLQFKNNTFLILAKYEDSGKFYIGLDNAFPPYKNLANYLITTEKFSYQDILMLYYFHIRGNPLVESTQQLVYTTNETPERIYNLTSSLPIKYLQHLISHIVNLSPLIIEFSSLDHFEAGDYVLINEDIYFFTNGVYQIFLKTISPEKNTYQCIKVNHKSFGQTSQNQPKTRTGTRLYIANTYTSATSNTPISSSDPTFYLTDKDLRTLTPKAGLFKYGGLLNSNWKILFDGTGKVATNTSVATTVSWGKNTVSGKLFYQNNDLLFTPTSPIPDYPHQNETLGLYESQQDPATTVTQNTNTTNTNKTISVTSVLRDSTYLVLTTSQLVAGNSTHADFSAFDIKIWKTTKELGENIAKSEFESSSPYATATVVANSPIGIGNASNASITNTISPNEKYIIQIKGVLSNTSKTNPTFLHVGSFTNTSETRFKAFS